MKPGDLVKHKTIKALCNGLIVELRADSNAAMVLWPQDPEAGPEHRNALCGGWLIYEAAEMLELISEK